LHLRGLSCSTARRSTPSPEFEKEQEGKRGLREYLAAELKRLERVRKDAVREAIQDKNRRMSKKNLDIHDHDARAKVNLARLSGRDRTGGRKAAALEMALGRNETALHAVDAVRWHKIGAGLRAG